MKILNCSLLLMTMTLCTPSYADFFISPFLGSQTASQHNDIDNDKSITIADETSFRTTGLVYGIKMGMFFSETLGIGLDYKKTSQTGTGQGIFYEETDIERKVDENILFATFYFRPTYISSYKVWLGLALNGKQVDSGDYNYKGESKITPIKSLKIGLGYNLSPSLTLSVEVEQLKTEKTKDIEQGNASVYLYNSIYLNYPTSSGRTTNVLVNLEINIL